MIKKKPKRTKREIEIDNAFFVGLNQGHKEAQEEFAFDILRSLGPPIYEIQQIMKAYSKRKPKRQKRKASK